MQASDLERIAARVCWFKPARETLANEIEFLCRVMQWGTWEDVSRVAATYVAEHWRRALEQAPPGILDARSWAFWTLRLGLNLPAPQRTLPNEASS